MVNSLEYTGLMSVYYKEKPEYLEQALASIIAQSCPPKYMILVEDGRLSPELYDVINKAKRNFENHKITFILQKNSSNMGLARSLNKGLVKNKTELVARFDSDDINVKDRMKKTLAVFKKIPSVTVVGSWIGEFSENPSVISGVRKVPSKQDEIRIFSKHRNPMNHMSVTFRADAVKKSGGYPIIPDFEDYALWNILLKKGKIFYNISEILVYARADLNFANRRRGLNYIRHEITFQKKMKSINYFSSGVILMNILTRSIVRILPSKMLKWTYSLLRKSN